MMDRTAHHTQGRTLLAYLADTATNTEAALAYEGLRIDLDRLAPVGALPCVGSHSGSRHDAYHRAREHLTALADGHAAFESALCRAELDVIWQREQAG